MIYRAVTQERIGANDGVVLKEALLRGGVALMMASYDEGYRRRRRLLWRCWAPRYKMLSALPLRYADSSVGAEKKMALRQRYERCFILRALSHLSIIMSIISGQHTIISSRRILAGHNNSNGAPRITAVWQCKHHTGGSTRPRF